MSENVNENIDTKVNEKDTENISETETKKRPKVITEGKGLIEKIGALGLTFYLWYSWGANYDYLSLSFLWYLGLVAIILLVPRIILFAFILVDRVYTNVEQAVYIIVNAVLMYFTIPYAIGIVVGN